MNKSDSDFIANMQAHVSKELVAARGDRGRMGELIERLTNSLALVIAVGAKGNPDGINTMCEGATAHLYERATDHAKLAQFMDGAKT